MLSLQVFDLKESSIVVTELKMIRKNCYKERRKKITKFGFSEDLNLTN